VSATGATLTTYTVTQGHWIHERIYMDRDPVATCNASSTSACFHYRQLYLEDVTAGTGGTLYTLYDTTTNQTPAGIPVSYPTWTKSQFTLQVQLDMNTANASTSVDVNTDNLTAYTQVAGTAGPTQSIETAGNLGEWDFDGNDSVALTATATPTATSTAYSAPGAMEYNAASEYDTVSVTATSTLYARFYMQVNANAASTVQVFALLNGTTQVGNLYLNSSNQFLTFFNTATSTSTQCANSVPFGTNTFHLVELKWVQNATTGSYTVKVDGTQTCSVTGVNTGSSQANAIRFGEVNAPSPAWDLTIDNVGVDSGQFLGAVSFAPTSLPTYQSFFGLSMGSVLASAGTVTPTTQVMHVSGTAAINTITPPSQSNCATAGSACQITFIPDGLWTTTTSGNIALASTAIVNQPLIFTYDPVAKLWYPSY
jgi:hypothetical protein